MFVDIELPIQFPPAITVPADAILDSGLKKTVFVDRGNGFFEPREVEIGWRLGNRVEITKGLKLGERIVVSGNFMIDSESRLEMAAAGMYGTLSKDPVCGADVSINKAEKTGRKSTYQGKTYYFSSDECKEKFEKNPERYVKK
jgi:YHS domain-containing protein